MNYINIFKYIKIKIKKKILLFKKLYIKKKNYFIYLNNKNLENKTKNFNTEKWNEN